MAIALLANTKISGANGGTTPSVDTTGATLLVIHLTDGDVASATVSDSKGNTWTQLTAQSGATPNSRLFYVANPTVGTGHTFTASGTGVYCVLTVQAFSGVVTTSPFDQQNGFAAATLTSGSNSHPGSITPGVDNELIVAGFAFDSQPPSVAVDSGMTITDQTAFGSGANYGGAMAYKVQTTAAAINPMWTWTGSATGGGLTIASFKAAASGLTTVSTTRATTWNTAATVATTRATTWTTAATVATTRLTTWTVGTPVATTRSTTWNTTAAVASSRATTWNTAAAVTPTRSTTWNVAAAITSTRVTTWTVSGLVATSRATTWNTAASVATSRATTWNVASSLTAVATSRSTTWNALAVATTTRSTTWTVQGVSPTEPVVMNWGQVLAYYSAVHSRQMLWQPVPEFPPPRRQW